MAGATAKNADALPCGKKLVRSQDSSWTTSEGSQIMKKTHSGLILVVAFVVLFLASRCYYAWITPYRLLCVYGNGPVVRNLSGGFATEWKTSYRVNRITGAEEVKYTDLLHPQASLSWRPTTRGISNNAWWYRLLP